MGQDVHVGVAPLDQLAIHPDLAVAVVIAPPSVLLPAVRFSFVAQLGPNGHKIAQNRRATSWSWNVNKADIKTEKAET
jgi:hypothetical protein